MAEATISLLQASFLHNHVNTLALQSLELNEFFRISHLKRLATKDKP